MNEFERKMHDEIAEGEKWLSTFSTPRPSAGAIERTKQAIRAELARPQLVRFASKHWAAWHGAVGAAAMVVLAVTIGWFSFEIYVKPPLAVPTTTDSLPVWVPETPDEATRFAGLDDGLSDLEEWSADQPWAVNGASLYDTLEGVLGEDAGKGTGETGALLSPSGDHYRANVVT